MTDVISRETGGVDIIGCIHEKMDKNKGRAYMHGKVEKTPPDLTAGEFNRSE